MKFMKAINKFFYALLALATVGMVGCQDAETYEPGAPEVEGCYDVYFPDANTLETQGPIGDVELDPTEKTEFTYTAYRNNTDDDITVPVVISTNTENKFVVSELKFEAGEDVAEFKVTLLESEIGVTYSLALSIEDPLYVKQYESNNTNALSVNVTRVKWDLVGQVSFTDAFLAWWLEDNPYTYDVRLEVRADSINKQAFEAALAGTGSDAGLAGIYRIVEPYNSGPYAGNVTLPGQSYGPYALTHNPGTHYLTFDATDPNKIIIPLTDVGLVINGAGSTSIVCSYAGYLIYADQESKITEDMYGKIVNGVLTFGTKMLLVAPSDGEGSLYYANQSGEFALNIAPELNCYELVAPKGDDDGDFAFENVKLPKDALFYSESQKLVSEVVLEKGKPAVDTDDADRTFVQQYGYVYRLPNLYAEGYPIYFTAALDGTLTSHPNFVEQETGLTQNGYDVYMWIDTAASTFDPETGLMNLVAEFYSYQGNYGVTYGMFNEAISVEAPDFPYAPALDLKSDFTYRAVFTDIFESDFQASEWEATLEKGSATGPAADAFEKAYGTAYRIPNLYKDGYDLYFAAGEDGKVVVPAGYELQATGVSIYGQPAYLKIMKGTMASNGVSLTVAVCDAEGNAIMPYACTESLFTYVWLDVATGTYTNGLMGDENGNPIPVDGLTLQNAEGTNLYRILEFWGYEDYHLNFTWDKGTNKCEVIGTCDTGYFYAGLGGNFHACDGLTGYALMGYELTWAQVEAQGVPQPSFDPATNTFTFPMFYVCWEAGKLYKAVDTFVLDGAVSEGPQWVDVDTGNYYSSLFIDDENYYIPFQGRKFQNLEGTNKYRVVNFTGADTDLNFTWDKTTNKCDIIGFNDTGVDSSVYGGKGNIYVCDVLTFYKANGHNITWEELATQIGGDAQSYFDPAEGEFVFYIIPAVPDMGPSVALGGGTIFTDYFVPDAAQAATTSSVKANLMSTSTVKEATINFNVAPRKRTLKGHTVGSVNLSYTKKSENKQTPVKRSIRENVKLNEKL